MPLVLACLLSVTPERWVGFPPGQQRLASQGLWLVSALCALGGMLWSGQGGDIIPGFTADPLGCLFFFAFAIIGFCAERGGRFHSRMPLAAVSACLAALSTHPLALSGTGSAALVLAFSGRQSAAAGCLRTLLFAAACFPASFWTAIVAAFVCCTGEGRRRADFAQAPLLEAGCGLLVLCRTFLRPDCLVTPVMMATLLVGGVLLSLGRLAIVLTTSRASAAMVGLAILPASFAIISVGLIAYAQAADSALTAHCAAAVLALDIVIFWPVAAGFLCTGAWVAEGVGTDRLGRLGGLLLFAPRLAAFLAVALFLLTCMPPGPGFSILWLLVEATLGLLADGFAAALPALVFLFGVGAIIALTALAALRFAALLLLGSARSPRMAACSDVNWKSLWPVAGTLGLVGLANCLPGGLLRLVEPALESLSGTKVEVARQPWFTLAAPDGLSSWMPVGLVGMLAVVLGIVWLLKAKLLSGQSIVASPAREILPSVHVGETMPWLGGLTTRTQQLPFGDPLIWSGLDMAPTAIRAMLLPAGSRSKTGCRRVAWLFRKILKRLRHMIASSSEGADYGAAAVLALAACALCVMAFWS